jgi:hypothetical protein
VGLEEEQATTKATAKADSLREWKTKKAKAKTKAKAKATATATAAATARAARR